MSRFWKVIKRECAVIIGQDGWLKTFVFWLPLSCFFMVWLIFSAGLPTNLPVAIVDYDRSVLSRSLMREIDATPVLRVTTMVTELEQGLSLVRSGKVYAVIVIPYALEQELRRGTSPAITAFYNSQYLLTGQLVTSSLQAVTLTKSSQLAVVNQMVKGYPLSTAVSQVLPLNNQMAALYNQTRNYVPFLVTAIIPAIWQLFIILAAVAALGSEQRHGSLSDWLAAAGGSVVLAWLGKMTPYCIVFSLYGAGYLLAVYGLLAWSISGSLSLLLLGQWLTVAVYLVLGSFCFAWMFHYGRATNMAAIYAAPALAFTGITYPILSMPLFAQGWALSLPITHYLKLQIQQANYAAPWWVSLEQFGVLGLFLLISVPTLLLLTRRLKYVENKPANQEV